MPNDTTTNHWLLLPPVYILSFQSSPPSFLGTSKDYFWFVFMNVAGLHHNIPVTALFSCPSTIEVVTTCEAANIVLCTVSGDLSGFPWIYLTLCYHLSITDPMELGGLEFYCTKFMLATMQKFPDFREICSFSICKQILWDRSGWPRQYAIYFDVWYFFVLTLRISTFYKTYLNSKNRTALIQLWSLIENCSTNLFKKFLTYYRCPPFSPL